MTNRKTTFRLCITVGVLALAVLVYFIRPANNSGISDVSTSETVTATNLPRLLDLGADKCVPCKMMAPILKELGTEFSAVFLVEFIDVWKKPSEAQPYQIKVIPTQIFFGANGTELYRHEGFLGREEILAKWNELGVSLTDKGV